MAAGALGQESFVRMRAGWTAPPALLDRTEEQARPGRAAGRPRRAHAATAGSCGRCRAERAPAL